MKVYGDGTFQEVRVVQRDFSFVGTAMVTEVDWPDELRGGIGTPATLTVTYHLTGPVKIIDKRRSKKTKREAMCSKHI